jgi:hypothetical protein
MMECRADDGMSGGWYDVLRICFTQFDELLMLFSVNVI